MKYLQLSHKSPDCESRHDIENTRDTYSTVAAVADSPSSLSA